MLVCEHIDQSLKIQYPWCQAWSNAIIAVAWANCEREDQGWRSSGFQGARPNLVRHTTVFFLALASILPALKWVLFTCIGVSMYEMDRMVDSLGDGWGARSPSFEMFNATERAGATERLHDCASALFQMVVQWVVTGLAAGTCQRGYAAYCFFS